MKKQQTKTHLTGKAHIGLLALIALLSSQAAFAQNKVVVVPLAGDDIPAINHPVADTFTNSIDMQFNTLPAGSFTMGSPSGEPGRSIDEVEHTVTLSKSFRMQTTEVTQAQWAATLIANNPSFHSGDNRPVETVSWYDAVWFTKILSDAEGRSPCYTFNGSSGIIGTGTLSFTTVTPVPNCTGYRLPTEAEWEYAARAGTTNAYANPIGFDDSDTETGHGLNTNLNAMGWYSHNDTNMGYATGTKPVAKKQANAWGLYDMHGNVHEWNWDWYAPYMGNATDPVGPANGSSRVFRGGCSSGVAGEARSAFRCNETPDYRFLFLGFRLVLTKVQ